MRSRVCRALASGRRTGIGTVGRAVVALGLFGTGGVAQQAPSRSLIRAPVPGAPAGVTAFIDVNVVPMDTERVLASQTVVVKDGWITALGPASQVKVPAGATQIAGQGKYLMPGLGDCHAHFSVSTSFEVDPGTSYDSTTAEGRLFLWLASGVTVIRNLDHSWSPAFRVKGAELLRLKARAAAGELWSPRIYASMAWAPPQYMQKMSSNTIAIGNVPPRLDSVAAYITAYKAAGFDHIKNYENYASVAIRDSVLATAHRIGLPVVGHAFYTESLEYNLAHLKSIDHLHAYKGNDSAQFQEQAAATKRAGVWNCPTLGITESARAMGYMPELIKPLQDAGAGLLVGTDAPTVPYLYGVQFELEALVRAGLTPYQALVAGTRNMATYFGTQDSVGTVAVRKRADLVLLTENPLAKIQAARRIAGVMIGGRWLSREEIDRRIPTIDAKGACPTQDEVLDANLKCKKISVE